MMPGEGNEDYGAFVRQKIRERVTDPVVAEKLVPKDHPFGSKRLPCESGYYEVFNQDNVLLVDVREAPIERITPTGVKTRDAEYALDVLIFATGYDAVTGALNRIAIRGEGGQTSQDKFAAGPRTYMGLQSAGFPNLFTINAASVGNFVRAAEPLVDWVSDCICYVRDHQLTRIAPTPEREVKGNKALPTQTVRWVRWRTGRACWELLTNGIVPAPWSVLEALSPWRWQVERVFCDRTEGVESASFFSQQPQRGGLAGVCRGAGAYGCACRPRPPRPGQWECARRDRASSGFPPPGRRVYRPDVVGTGVEREAAGPSRHSVVEACLAPL